MKSKFAVPDVGSNEIRLVSEAIKSKWLTAGDVVRQFERGISELSQTDRAVALDSCYNSMELTLRALGIGPGDEVITTPYTYTATAAAIHNVGAKIVFVDLDESGESFEMDYMAVARAITEKTKAVMPVDIGGKLCDYDALRGAIGFKANVYQPANPFQEAIGRVAIIADAAHSFGAEMYGKMSGEWADFTCFSFHVLKCITTGGEGGAVAWKDIPDFDNDGFEKKLRLLADNGQTSRDKTRGWEYDIALIGHNSIMTNLDAAMGLSQLERYSSIREKRIDVTLTYDNLFEEIGAVTKRVRPLIKHFGPKYTTAMHLYPVRVKHPCAFTPEDEEKFRNYIYWQMAHNGVPCNVHYKPLPMMTAYKALGFSINDYPKAYEMYRSLLTIPYHTELEAEEQKKIVSILGEAVSSI